MQDVPPLVELGDTLMVHADGLSHCEVYDGKGHFYFFETRRDGILPSAPLVRAVVLHLIVPRQASIEGMHATAGVLDMRVRGRLDA